MSKNTLEKLYAGHKGKVSDKWLAYLVEYERIFDKYRDEPVRLLEIGIQNGGSLEIWSKYFPQALKLMGCDIDTECTSLIYEDPRITVFVGDVNSDEVQQAILKTSSSLDIIIDDGSHFSGDIMKTFVWGFSHLSDGGVFVIEDLHCSYWKHFEGGPFNPFSSMTFFQYLTDIMNFEHWGITETRTDVLQLFSAKYGFQINEETLRHIHSVEFINSLCVIRKEKPEDNGLGTRIIAGLDDRIVPHLSISKDLPFSPEQIESKWINVKASLDKTLFLHEKELHKRDEKIVDLEHQNRNLQQVLTEKEGEISGLYKDIAECRQKIGDLEKNISLYKYSVSWRVTKPFRVVLDYACHAIPFVRTVFASVYNKRRLSNGHDYGNAGDKK